MLSAEDVFGNNRGEVLAQEEGGEKKGLLPVPNVREEASPQVAPLAHKRLTRLRGAKEPRQEEIPRYVGRM